MLINIFLLDVKHLSVYNFSDISAQNFQELIQLPTRMMR